MRAQREESKAVAVRAARKCKERMRPVAEHAGTPRARRDEETSAKIVPAEPKGTTCERTCAQPAARNAATRGDCCVRLRSSASSQPPPDSEKNPTSTTCTVKAARRRASTAGGGSDNPSATDSRRAAEADSSSAAG